MDAVESRRWPAVMVDLETLGTSDDAAILEVGAVCFDLESRTMGPQFNAAISLKSNGEHYRRIDAETLAWWMGQWRERGGVPDLNDAAYAYEFPRAMFKFADFWQENAADDAEFWSRGSFDERIMFHALTQSEGAVPWKFYKVRDQRSVLDWEGVRMKKNSHSALEDAIAQVEALFVAVTMRQAAGGERAGAESAVISDQGKAFEAVEAFADLLIQRAGYLSTVTDGGGLNEIVLKDVHFTSGDEAYRLLRDAVLRRHEAKASEVRVRLWGDTVREDWKPVGDGGPTGARDRSVPPPYPLPDVAREAERFMGSLVSTEDLRELFLCALEPVSPLRAAEMKMRLRMKYPGLMKELETGAGCPGNGLGQDAPATRGGEA